MTFSKTIARSWQCMLALWVMQVTLVAARTIIRDSAISGCGQTLPTGQQHGNTANVTIESDGLTRSYLVFVPPHYNPYIPTSVIFSYHGGSRTAQSQLQLDQLTNPEFNTALIVVYPQGINDTWQGVPGITTNDVQFTADILAEVESRYCIDPHRVFVTGKSDGGGFCNVLACDPTLSARFAAFAPVSGAYYVDTLPCNATTVNLPCSPARHDIPLLAFHGGNDTTISYNGGERKDECLPTIPHFIEEWAARDLLSPDNTTIPIANNTVLYRYGAGLETGLVGLVYDAVIGHDWPSTAPNADNQVAGHHPASFNATPIILGFFATHPLIVL
ncbi:hypothetical protein LTR10_024030 [Elasticomyces elasticus]|uniref:feruloyl esterase n=1 Tax=Exophiala sideris TaxID=1016849 RepID=A0ABR0JM42_9EURO|nr:hypothetical protein LTR10_024030 [Elasticomyces elasticus]KAK5036639.1 hypothetical protein LTS07_002366 [Exophiala sideris]KAK5041529.1 hypothetical protein LTR13_002196 [Exophiala sideris]KAK5067023.1 hypothetical protein LTR69_002371 [Exophiala sideris]KAK5185081.1 hypothetical protein LTR44_002927 [Eurotiomycetes sp. CCFEE 6388]